MLRDSRFNLWDPDQIEWLYIVIKNIFLVTIWRIPAHLRVHSLIRKLSLWQLGTSMESPECLSPGSLIFWTIGTLVPSLLSFFIDDLGKWAEGVFDYTVSTLLSRLLLQISSVVLVDRIVLLVPSAFEVLVSFSEVLLGVCQELKLLDGWAQASSLLVYYTHSRGYSLLDGFKVRVFVPGRGLLLDSFRLVNYKCAKWVVRAWAFFLLGWYNLILVWMQLLPQSLPSISTHRPTYKLIKPLYFREIYVAHVLVLGFKTLLGCWIQTSNRWFLPSRYYL